MNPAPGSDVSTGVPETVRLVANMVVSGAADAWPRNAIALRNLCRAVFETDGRIQGLEAEDFSRREGRLLFRGFSFFRHVRESLNGEWFGTGFMSDGNYYTGYEARTEAIDDYGFSSPYGPGGWAMAYKLRPSARLTEREPMERVLIDQFVQHASEQYSANEDALATLYGGYDNGIRAVLMGYDGMVDPERDHYVIYNHRALAYNANCTPWAHGLEPAARRIGSI